DGQDVVHDADLRRIPSPVARMSFTRVQQPVAQVRECLGERRAAPTDTASRSGGVTRAPGTVAPGPTRVAPTSALVAPLADRVAFGLQAAHPVFGSGVPS